MHLLSDLTKKNVTGHSSHVCGFITFWGKKASDVMATKKHHGRMQMSQTKLYCLSFSSLNSSSCVSFIYSKPTVCAACGNHSFAPYMYIYIYFCWAGPLQCPHDVLRYLIYKKYFRRILHAMLLMSNIACEIHLKI